MTDDDKPRKDEERELWKRECDIVARLFQDAYNAAALVHSVFDIKSGKKRQSMVNTAIGCLLMRFLIDEQHMLHDEAARVTQRCLYELGLTRSKELGPISSGLIDEMMRMARDRGTRS